MTVLRRTVEVSKSLDDTWAFLADFAAFAEKEMKAGKTVDQAAKEFKVDAKYKGYVASANPQFGGPKPNMQIAFDELKKAELKKTK